VHVKVEKEPPEGGGVINGWVVSVGDDYGTYDQCLKVAEGWFVARAKEVLPSSAEVWWFMVVYGGNEI
jgi:hypothetical protein